MTFFFLSATKRFLLGSDATQRARASHALLVLAMYVGYACVQEFEVAVGLVDAFSSRRETVVALCGQLILFLCIRGELNLRLKSGRSLLVPQTLWALFCTCWSYAITGPARGAVLTILAVTILYGVFSSRPARVALLAGLGFLLLVGTVLWKVWTDPSYDPRVETVHLALAAVSVAGAATAAARMSGLRRSLELKQIELALALERIQALATCDELTGLFNRRAALERMRSELGVRGRSSPLMALVMIDIDHFKSVNDRLGHSAGDLVLQRFADRARTVVRSGDFVARWGGEEFLMVMPATSAEKALAAMRRLRDVLHAESFNDLAGGLVVNFSAGVTECTGLADLHAAIERADQAMYRAKQGGRDCALIAAPPVIAPVLWVPVAGAGGQPMDAATESTPGPAVPESTSSISA